MSGYSLCLLLAVIVCQRLKNVNITSVLRYRVNSYVQLSIHGYIFAADSCMCAVNFLENVTPCIMVLVYRCLHGHTPRY